MYININKHIFFFSKIESKVGIGKNIFLNDVLRTSKSIILSVRCWSQAKWTVVNVLTEINQTCVAILPDFIDKKSCTEDEHMPLLLISHYDLKREASQWDLRIGRHGLASVTVTSQLRITGNSHLPYTSSIWHK